MNQPIAAKLLSIFSLIFVLFKSSTALAAPTGIVTFEGYYKILAGQKHVGYVVHRYQFDAAKKRFYSVQYLKTNASFGNLTESLSAVSNDKFHPISYQFTATVGNTVKILDAQFEGRKMTTNISNGQKSNTVTSTLGKGNFLAVFLVPLMMSKGLMTDKRYEYAAIAESEGKAYKGNAYVEKKMVMFKGQKVYKVLNVFKDERVIFYLTEDGEYLGSRSPAQQIYTELVSNPREATTGIPVNTAHLTKLFGSVPLGKKNVLAKSPQISVVPEKSKTMKLEPDPNLPEKKNKDE